MLDSKLGKKSVNADIREEGQNNLKVITHPNSLQHAFKQESAERRRREYPKVPGTPSTLRGNSFRNVMENFKKTGFVERPSFKQYTSPATASTIIENENSDCNCIDEIENNKTTSLTPAVKPTIAIVRP